MYVEACRQCGGALLVFDAYLIIDRSIKSSSVQSSSVSARLPDLYSNLGQVWWQRATKNCMSCSACGIPPVSEHNFYIIAVIESIYCPESHSLRKRGYKMSVQWSGTWPIARNKSCFLSKKVYHISQTGWDLRWHTATTQSLLELKIRPNLCSLHDDCKRLPLHILAGCPWCDCRSCDEYAPRSSLTAFNNKTEPIACSHYRLSFAPEPPILHRLCAQT